MVTVCKIYLKRLVTDMMRKCFLRKFKHWMPSIWIDHLFFIANKCEDDQSIRRKNKFNRKNKCYRKSEQHISIRSNKCGNNTERTFFILIWKYTWKRFLERKKGKIEYTHTHTNLLLSFSIFCQNFEQLWPDCLLKDILLSWLVNL